MSEIDNLPKELQKNINNVLSKYSSPPCFKTSMQYLLTNCVYALLVLGCTILLENYMNPYLLFILYSVVMGTVCMGLWVLGHECGHGAFGSNTFQNDIVGYILHSSLLVPYFSWKYSHEKHHKYCNHLTLGETHVPFVKKDLSPTVKLHNIIGDDAFAIFNLINHLIFGWPAYLFSNVTGGRKQIDLKTDIDNNKWKDHFHSNSQVMKKTWRIELSTIGCITTLYTVINSLGWSSLFWYFGPYLVINMWLVVYTWLQHTHPDVPHYGNDSFTFLKGALSTIDRPYPKIIDDLHHHIGSTHVMHHLKYSIPHYRAQQCTKELKIILQKHYRFDSTPILESLLKTAKSCHYVDDITGIQKYKKF
tara:strand:- start:95 stop:1180 length:1086 start_codon:yes stop_codon:yes gene_type:complete